MTSQILDYHQATKHSPESIRQGGRAMDWSNRPTPFKRYQVELAEVGLACPPVGLAMPALTALAVPAPQDPGRLDCDGLARLLNYGAGVLRKLVRPDGPPLYFRTYASAGGLYPVEAYLVTGGMAGLDAGVYHFHPLRHSLRRLREGDWRGWLAQAAASPATADSIVLTGMPWRTAWKYGDRGFRHLYWDAGMIAANLLALAAAVGVDATLVHGYDDARVEALLGLDGHTEFPLCLLTLGGGADPPETGAPPPLDLPRTSLSRAEIEDPAIVAAEVSGRLAGAAAVQAWRGSFAPLGPVGRPARSGEAVEPPAGGVPPDRLEAVIRRRGSARQFDLRPMPREALAAILAAASAGIRTDVWPGGSRLVTPYLIANRVTRLAAGAYVYTGGFQRLAEGDFAELAAFLCLEQWLGGDAAATGFLATDLAALVGAAGDRAYRVAQLEAGVVAGRIYLGAYASGLAASGLTFFDDAVAAFFAPDVAGGRVDCLLVAAVGPATRRLLPLA